MRRELCRLVSNNKRLSRRLLIPSGPVDLFYIPIQVLVRGQLPIPSEHIALFTFANFIIYLVFYLIIFILLFYYVLGFMGYLCHILLGLGFWTINICLYSSRKSV